MEDENENIESVNQTQTLRRIELDSLSSHLVESGHKIQLQPLDKHLFK